MLNGLCRPELKGKRRYFVKEESWAREENVESILYSGDDDDILNQYGHSATILITEERWIWGK